MYTCRRDRVCVWKRKRVWVCVCVYVLILGSHHLSQTDWNLFNNLSTPVSVCSACWDTKTKRLHSTAKGRGLPGSFYGYCLAHFTKKKMAAKSTAIQTFWHNAKMPVKSPGVGVQRLLKCMCVWNVLCWVILPGHIVGRGHLYMQSKCKEFMWQRPLQGCHIMTGHPVEIWCQFV